MSDEYPKKVVYCGNCGLPPEFCEYGVKFESCKPWLIANVPHLYPQLVAAAGGGAAGTGSGDAAVDAAAAAVGGLTVADDSDSDSDSDSDDDAPKKKSHRGGQVQRGGPKGKKGPQAGAVIITKKDRGKRKYVTSVAGLEGFGLKLKEVASALGKKFGAGASVTKNAEGRQEIDVQGDLCYDLPDVLTAQFGIPEDAIIVKE